MEELKQRCHQGLLAVLPSWAFRPGYIMTLLLAGAFSLLMFPLLRMIGLQVHATITGSYISGSHSLALLSCPNEQIARDIARAIMEKKLAASVDIFPRTSTM
ncbi:hypothetical protein JD844_004880 [Phrynosoma platyrhinos]|uniref:Uncharacterized protein n=1 Tax=Phrynosoma platyrhinos TaxID=52577 RepID=A0ABQ7SDW4_PHRPL|nr:hypothetical protein JD844_004880 [Phrynosoma platyrhinos]